MDAESCVKNCAVEKAQDTQDMDLSTGGNAVTMNLFVKETRREECLLALSRSAVTNAKGRVNIYGSVSFC
jgi:hypothetical protein